ncbi:hypothetical protein QFC21_006733 [Naganishia friedmannii]|uniref:Uncharacterized protein n=1 Tax=Naganishia friedmannii TaxID=89922 RepID=A0ACC2V0Q8_9TREE|nr:hypothetical protein QFC21_006733 [Naganishia friedmannii]
MFRRGGEDADSSDSEPEAAQPNSQDSTNSKPVDKINEDEAPSDDEEEGGLFGNMLDIPPEEDKEKGESNEASRVVTPREFPLPKHLPSAFALPKKLLSDLIVSRKAMAATRRAPSQNEESDRVSSVQPEQRFVVTTLEYTDINRGSRLKRYRLDIVFTPEGKSISKGNKHVSAVARQAVSGSASAATTTPDGPSGTATPASTVSIVEGAEQFPSIETALKDVKLSSSEAEDQDGKNQSTASPVRASTKPAEPVFLDDSTYMIQMEDVGCPTSSEAENYLALVALHEFTTGTHHSLMTSTKSIGLGLSSMTAPSCVALRMEYPPINARHLPLPYRDLWDELERTRKLQEDEDSRVLWKGLDGILERQVVESDMVATGNQKQALGNGIKGVSSEPGNPSAKGRQSRRSPDALAFDQRIQAGWAARSQSPAYQKMLKQRETLPIADYREEIVKALEEHQVLVLSGETGCGKSTQLPSFILESHLAKGLPCKILVTEPRRISAISLADRVSKELGDTGVGGSDGQGSLVGYSIRLENKIGKNTRLAFVTNGIALRMLENSAGSEGQAGSFDEVTHIVVDEVHERSIDSDFIMIVLKSLMQERKDLKIILMSATMNSEKICAYFDNCPFFKVPGRTFPVQVNYLEDAVELTQYFIAESSPYAVRRKCNLCRAPSLDPDLSPASRWLDGRNRKQIEWSEETANNDEDDDGDLDQPSDPMKLSSSAYSQETVRTVNLLDPKQIPYGLIMRLLEHLCLETNSQYSQAILIFLPGINEIRKLHDLLVDHNQLGNARDYKIYPLHSTISSENQGAVFEIPPEGMRKIVLSTNIAETGVTIPDITCVIDSGKHREMRYDEKRSISRLTETYIARSNAAQRRGRAGRVQEGLAFHLFTRARHDTQLDDHPEPEILRLSLQDLALRIKILKVKVGTSIAGGLSKALDPPSPINVARAVSSLVEVKALTTAEEITPMGLLLSRLPVDVHLGTPLHFSRNLNPYTKAFTLPGKFLLLAALFKCLDPALTIAATLNSKSPFVAPFGREQEADTIKQSFKKELRQQLYSYLVDTNFVRITPAEKEAIARARYRKGFRTSFVTIPNELNENAEDENMLNAALVAGLYPKILIVEGGNGLKTLGNNQSISIHPSSINFRGRIADFGVNHMVYYTIMQSKKLYAWETSPVDDIALFLLCGEILDIKTWASSVILDRKIKFNMPPITILALQRLRTEFANCLSQRMASIPLDPEQEKWFELGLKCIMKTVEEEQEDAYKLRISGTNR